MDRPLGDYPALDSSQRKPPLPGFVRRVFAILCWVSLVAGVTISSPTACGDVTEVANGVQPKLVKVYGAGGLRGLEAYQSGFLISPNGIVLTVWSYVLDADPVLVVMHDGLRLEAELLGADPAREIAVLKIDAQDAEAFSLAEAVEPAVGGTILAFSNLFGVATGNEPMSVQQGCVSATTLLSTRQGAMDSLYQGRVIVIDAMTNNPGAPGGALTDAHGRLMGVLGKELRESRTGTWLNYAIPIAELAESIAAIERGATPPVATWADPGSLPKQAWSIEVLGLRLIPDVLPVTPPFVESTVPGSAAETAGLRSDDLITFVNDRLVRSQKDLSVQLARCPQHEPLELVVQRKNRLVRLKVEPKL
jgi:serine protease Do